MILSFNEQFNNLAQVEGDLLEVCSLSFFDSLHVCDVFCISDVHFSNSLLLVFTPGLVFSDLCFLMSTCSSLLRNMYAFAGGLCGPLF